MASPVNRHKMRWWLGLKTGVIIMGMIDVTQSSNFASGVS